MRLKFFAAISLLIILFPCCKLIGLHFDVENPKKPGVYPELTKAQKILAQKTIKRTCFDVKYYNLDLKIVPDKKFIDGKVTITSLLLSKNDSIQIDLYQNLKIDSIILKEKKVNFKRVEGAVFIKLPESINSGDLFSLEINYSGKPREAKNPPWNGGTVWKKDKSGNVWAGVACESDGASLWWPNKDDVADEADSIDVYLTVPEKLNAISNGVCKETKLKEQGTKRVHWHISYPINNYNVTFYVGDYKLIEDTFVSKQDQKVIKMSYYVLPKNYNIAKAHFQQVKKHIEFYEKVFGNYPWPKDGFKLIESPYEGMEHQTAIAYGNKYKNGVDGFDYILLHETAHEWWGNSVTAADLSDVWLQEGFATYSEALFVEDTKGPEAYTEYMYWERLTIKNKLPVVRRQNLRFFSPSDEDVYMKGAWVLHTLRNTINNDSVFFDILKTFRTENHLKQIYSNTFIDLVNKKTKTDYNWFFKQYLYKREAPILEYCWTGGFFYYKWAETENDFNRLPVKLEFGNISKTIYPNTELQKIKTDATFGKSVIFSDRECYFGNKLNLDLYYKAQD